MRVGDWEGTGVGDWEGTGVGDADGTERQQGGGDEQTKINIYILRGCSECVSMWKK
jgi:hypothetical protein